MRKKLQPISQRALAPKLGLAFTYVTTPGRLQSYPQLIQIFTQSLTIDLRHHGSVHKPYGLLLPT